MSKESAITEFNLICQAMKGVPSAYKSIYDLYGGRLYAICSRYIVNDENVKDVIQDSFIKIFSALGSFEYRGEGSFRSWMSRIVINESLRFIKDNGLTDWTDVNDLTEHPADEEPEIDGLTPEVIHTLIRELPDGYRTIFNLYVIEEHTHKEIAELLGIKESSSASQLHRAKALLAAKIKQYQNQQ